MPDALLEYSNAAGDDFSTAKDTTHVFGPYLRAIPRLPVGANKGKTDFVGVVPAATTANGGWYYNESTGQVRANCKDSETDDAGVKYNAY
jgi:hypothetical protein